MREKECCLAPVCILEEAAACKGIRCPIKEVVMPRANAIQRAIEIKTISFNRKDVKP